MSRYQFIHAEKATFEVQAMCRVLGVSPSAYYSWLKRTPTARDRRRATLAMKVTHVYEKSGRTYGSPRVREKLVRLGEVVSVKTVARLMQENGQIARRKKRFKATTDSRHTKRVAPNLLARDFRVAAPNRVWVTDVKAIWTARGWVYLAAIVDLFARRAVGWALSESNDTALALAALERAVLARAPLPGLIHHSDRGSPYGSDDYVAALKRIGAVQSMSRKGDCWDNAVAESFFATIEHECLRGSVPWNITHATRVIKAYIDDFYNPERLHSTLGYVSPIEFELSSATLEEAA